MNSQSPKTAEPGKTLGEIAREFLRLGFIAFGGPAAHIALMEEEFVGRRRWVTRERFLDLVGAVSLLPGPSSTELAIYLGQIRGGMLGLILAGVAFILPAAALVTGLAWAYVRFGSVPQVAGLLFGVKPVVVVVLAQAIWALGKTALKTWELAALAAVALALTISGAPALAVLIGAGVAWMVANRTSRAQIKSATVASLLMSGAGSASAAVSISVTAVFFYFVKVGAVLFGSGYVLLAVLRAAALADGNAVAGCHRGEPGDPRTVLHRVNVSRVRVGRVARSGIGHSGDVLARVYLCSRIGEYSSESAPISARERISRWSKCSSPRFDDFRWLAVYAGNHDKRAGLGFSCH
jgi:chromate transport protein ChrA